MLAAAILFVLKSLKMWSLLCKVDYPRKIKRVIGVTKSFLLCSMRIDFVPIESFYMINGNMIETGGEAVFWSHETRPNSSLLERKSRNN